MKKLNNFMVKEIEPFFGRKKDNRAIKIEWLDSKHSGQEQPRIIRLIIDILRSSAPKYRNEIYILICLFLRRKKNYII